MTDLAVWDWCLVGLMTAERLFHTHTHTHMLKYKDEYLHQTHMPAQTQCTQKMNSCSHINWKLDMCLNTFFFVKQIKMLNESTCHDLSVFKHVQFLKIWHKSLDQVPARLMNCLFNGSSHDYLSNLFKSQGEIHNSSI